MAEGDQPVARLALREHGRGVDRRLRVEGRELLRALETARLRDEVDGARDVAGLRELPLDQRDELRELLRRVEDGRRRQPEREVLEAGLAELRGVLSVVEQVVDHLGRTRGVRDAG